MAVGLFLSVLASTLVAANISPQDTLKSHPVVHSLSVVTGTDYVASSARDEIRGEIPVGEEISINSAIPVSLRYAFSFTDSGIAHYLPGGYQGIGMGLLNYGAAQPGGSRKAHRNIGYPMSLYIFQGGPFWHHSNLYLDYEWNFGASFGWKPYSETNRYFNLAVGSRVNAYLNLDMYFRWQIDPRFALIAGVAASHFSNGNTSFPNPGVNQFGLRLGMVYTLNPPREDFPAAVPDTTSGRKLQYDISLWGATRKRVYRGGETPVLLKGHFACAGISFAPMVKLNTWWRVGGSLDLQWDESSDLKKNYVEGTSTEDIRFTHPNFFRQVTVGLSAHGELRMPVFAVNVGVGYNLLAPWENRGSYQNITLKTYLCKFLFINVGYQLRNFHQQSSLMLGLGTTL